MISRRGVPFPVQDDTRREPEVNPIERVSGTQSLTQEKTFDYTRALTAEKAKLQVDVRESDQIVNPQPKTTLPIDFFKNQGVIAERPIYRRLTADQLDFSQRFKKSIRSRNYVSESVQPHQRGFGNPERKTEYPGKDGEVVHRESLNFLDRFFNWLNSVLGE